MLWTHQLWLEIPIGGMLNVNKLWLTCTLLWLVFSAQMVQKLNSFTSSCILPFTFPMFCCECMNIVLVWLILLRQGVCYYLEYNYSPLTFPVAQLEVQWAYSHTVRELRLATYFFLECTVTSLISPAYMSLQSIITHRGYFFSNYSIIKLVLDDATWLLDNSYLLQHDIPL